MAKQDRIVVDISPRMMEGIDRLVASGEFGTRPDYIRHLIHLDLAKRLAELDQQERKPGPSAEV